ncbi:unnamed protein product [Urochloa humidicola]
MVFANRGTPASPRSTTSSWSSSASSCWGTTRRRRACCWRPVAGHRDLLESDPCQRQRLMLLDSYVVHHGAQRVPGVHAEDPGRRVQADFEGRADAPLSKELLGSASTAEGLVKLKPGNRVRRPQEHRGHRGRGMQNTG